MNGEICDENFPNNRISENTSVIFPFHILQLRGYNLCGFAIAQLHQPTVYYENLGDETPPSPTTTTKTHPSV